MGLDAVLLKETLSQDEFFFEAIGFGIRDWLVDAEVDLVVVAAAVVVFFVAESNTRVKVLKIYNQKVELPPLYAFSVLVPKCRGVHQVEFVCRLMPLQQVHPWVYENLLVQLQLFYGFG